MRMTVWASGCDRISFSADKHGEDFVLFIGGLSIRRHYVQQYCSILERQCPLSPPLSYHYAVPFCCLHRSIVPLHCQCDPYRKHTGDSPEQLQCHPELVQ
jgi:hypothetical protein